MTGYLDTDVSMVIGYGLAALWLIVTAWIISE